MSLRRNLRGRILLHCTNTCHAAKKKWQLKHMLHMHHFTDHVKQTLSRRNTRKTNPKAFHSSSISSWRHYLEHAMLALIASYGGKKTIQYASSLTIYNSKWCFKSYKVNEPTTLSWQNLVTGTSHMSKHKIQTYTEVNISHPNIYSMKVTYLI